MSELDNGVVTPDMEVADEEKKDVVLEAAPEMEAPSEAADEEVEAAA